MKPHVIVLTIGIAILKKKSKSETFTDGWTDQWAEDRHQMIKRAHLNLWIQRHNNLFMSFQILNHFRKTFPFIPCSPKRVLTPLSSSRL